MSKVNALLNERLKKNDNNSKMAAMAQQSASGNLTSFAGVFSISELSSGEKSTIETILNEYALGDKANFSQDLSSLLSITSEVKAINNQAALLHGERIKKAQNILVCYRDGAFTAWLLAAYGNRQTPYNLMQYYEFCEAMPKMLRPQIETMPRQAIYTLASRDGDLEKKQTIIENYKGETKAELLSLIRTVFPLSNEDGRRQNIGESATQTLKRFYRDLKRQPLRLTTPQKSAIKIMLQEILEMVNAAKAI
ncbi:MAG: CT583 family protein [Parachlamydiaceae bacterium]|nr:CT583 family protein [Parachlamydiaceae bacterium]